jgi:hypothetical protein
VLATGKTNAAGEYAFKAPDRGYHIVATGDKLKVSGGQDRRQAGE